MRHPGPLLAALLALVLGACSSPFGDKLSYAEVQSLNPGVSASWVLQEFPQGRVARGPDGKVTSITYPVTDPRGASQTLLLEFDRREILSRKLYSGRVVRPGGSGAKPVCP